VTTPDFSPSAAEQQAFALTSDNEWVIVVQPQSAVERFQCAPEQRFHFAIARRNVILLQGEFSLERGQGLADRLQEVSENLQSGKLHKAFHSIGRAQGAKIRKLGSCKGMCPFVCPGSRFDEIRLKYSWKVSQDMRQRGSRLFLGWETPIVTS